MEKTACFNNSASRSIVEKYVDEASAMLGKNLVKVILYGSYARGEERENSDIDLLFLTSLSDEENRREENALYDTAFDYQMDYGVDISVIVKNKEQFEHWLGALPFYDNIEREGVVLNG